MPEGLKVEDRYIGDGVYASFDGYHIWLKTQDGMQIALEPEVYFNLLNYKDHVWEKIEQFKSAQQEKQNAN